MIAGGYSYLLLHWWGTEIDPADLAHHANRGTQTNAALTFTRTLNGGQDVERAFFACTIGSCVEADYLSVRFLRSMPMPVSISPPIPAIPKPEAAIRPPATSIPTLSTISAVGLGPGCVLMAFSIITIEPPPAPIVSPLAIIVAPVSLPSRRLVTSSGVYFSFIHVLTYHLLLKLFLHYKLDMPHCQPIAYYIRSIK